MIGYTLQIDNVEYVVIGVKPDGTELCVETADTKEHCHIPLPENLQSIVAGIDLTVFNTESRDV